MHRESLRDFVRVSILSFVFKCLLSFCSIHLFFRWPCPCRRLPSTNNPAHGIHTDGCVTLLWELSLNWTWTWKQANRLILLSFFFWSMAHCVAPAKESELGKSSSPVGIEVMAHQIRVWYTHRHYGADFLTHTCVQRYTLLRHHFTCRKQIEKDKKQENMHSKEWQNVKHERTQSQLAVRSYIT